MSNFGKLCYVIINIHKIFLFFIYLWILQIGCSKTYFRSEFRYSKMLVKNARILFYSKYSLILECFASFYKILSCEKYLYFECALMMCCCCTNLNFNLLYGNENTAAIIVYHIFIWNSKTIIDNDPCMLSWQCGSRILQKLILFCYVSFE